MGERLVVGEVGIGEGAADLAEDLGRREGVGPGISVLQQWQEGLASMRVRDGSAECSPEPFIGPNLMHLLWCVSGNVIGAVAPRAGASR